MPLILVLGHEKCGAVSAAVDVVEHGTFLPGSLMSMVEPAWSWTLTAETLMALAGTAFAPLPALVMSLPAGSTHETPFRRIP